MAKRIIIIGGGFAGLNFVKNLDSKAFEVTLVDRNNYLFFPPLLYQVATGFLEPSSISYPYRKMLRNKPNFNFKLGEVLKIVPDENKVILNTGELEYEYLVLAMGTKTNYFGLKNVEQKAIPMKTVDDALEMRNFLLKQLERATSFTSDENRLKKTLTIVVAGGGPTGIEISGMLAEMRMSVFRKDYPEFEKVSAKIHIYLVDGAQQLLSPMTDKSQRNTYNELEKLGVKIVLNAQVTDYVDDKVLLSNGQIIETENLIWAAGVTAQEFDGLSNECYGRGRRLVTDAYNKLERKANIYAIGDISIQTTDKKFPSGHPQVAQVALQQGESLAKNFLQLQKNRLQIPFAYKDKGSMAIIGRNKAVVDIPSGLHLKGFFAWFIWIFIHLVSLVHYRNRITTVFNWVVAYFTKDQALRMIIRPVPKEKDNESLLGRPTFAD